MIFKRAVQRYGRTPVPETPYQRAGQLWDERIGPARVQARSWRLMAFGCLGLTTALSGGLLWQSLQSRVVPYVVEVDRLGEARAVEPAVRNYQPTDPQVAWFLSRFITEVRARSLDPVLMRADWLSAYDFTTKRGAAFLGDYARSADPFGQVGERTVSVQVTSVVRASDKSFQVKWIETAYERGSQAGTSHWTAILTVVMMPPPSADILRPHRRRTRTRRRSERHPPRCRPQQISLPDRRSIRPSPRPPTWRSSHEVRFPRGDRACRCRARARPDDTHSVSDGCAWYRIGTCITGAGDREHRAAQHRRADRGATIGAALSPAISS